MNIRLKGLGILVAVGCKGRDFFDYFMLSLVAKIRNVTKPIEVNSFGKTDCKDSKKDNILIKMIYNIVFDNCHQLNIKILPIINHDKFVILRILSILASRRDSVLLKEQSTPTWYSTLRLLFVLFLPVLKI